MNNGHNRLSKIRYPSKTTPGTSSTTDFEQFTYDAAGNVLTERRRDGQVFSNSYDGLSRLVVRDAPGAEPDSSYAYDNFGRLVTASRAGQTLSYVFDALGRLVSEAQPQGTVAYQYDAAGRRTRLTWPDGLYLAYDYLVTGEATKIRENGASSGVGVLATYAYDDLGRRVSLSRGNGTSTGYAFDAASRLESLTQNLAGTADDLTQSFSYNPAGQIRSQVSSNPSYGWNPLALFDAVYASNGLNQATSVAGSSLSYDDRGNMTADGLGRSFAYDADNRLVSASGGGASVALSYDPAGRLWQEAGSATTRFLYDGADLIAEYDASGNLQRRYAHGPGTDEPSIGAPTPMNSGTKALEPPTGDGCTPTRAGA